MTDEEFIGLLESTSHLTDENKKLRIEFNDVFKKIFQFINGIETYRKMRLNYIFGKVDHNKMSIIVKITMLRLTFLINDMENWQLFRDKSYNDCVLKSKEEKSKELFVGLL